MSDHKGLGSCSALCRQPLISSPTVAMTVPGSARNWKPRASNRPCRSRKVQYAYNIALYRQRHKVENLFAKLKDWRRIATRYDRCAHTFFSAICIAAAVILWL